MSLSKDKNDGIIVKLAGSYVRLLQERPILTKSISSGVISGFGDLIAQIIKYNPQKGQYINLRSTAAFGTFGLVFAGPLIHQFYIWLDQLVPKNSPYCSIKRVLIDRGLFAPPFILLFFFVVTILEGQGTDVAKQKIRENFWSVLKMNWKIWTIFQYINVNYVPMQFRVLFSSMVSLIWNMYLAFTRR